MPIQIPASPLASVAQTSRRGYLFWGLVIPLVVYAGRAAALLMDSQLAFDTQYTYLPLARQLLEQGVAFWQSPDSLRSAPGIYTYMALAGGDVPTLKIVDLIMALTVVIMLADLAWRVTGNLAAGATAWILVLSPFILPLSIAPMAEPPALFLLSLWLWATTCSVQTQVRGWRLAALVVFSGITLAAATLTRATLMYWIPALTVLSAIALILPQSVRSLLPWRRLFTVHLIALIGVGAYMVKNEIDFGKPAIATGAGAALYFGTNPLTYGQEPPFFGLQHDEGYITRDTDHLSLKGDRRLTAAAVSLMQQAPASALWAMFANDAGSLLFFSKSHLRNYGDRIWRVCLVMLAIAGVWAGRKKPVVRLLTLLTAYMWIVHLPALYNPRYSILALDIELSVLAGIGLAFLLQHSHRKWLVPGTLGVLALGSVIGAAHQRYSSAMQVNFSALPLREIHAASPGDIQTKGFSGDPFTSLATMTSDPAHIVWKDRFREINGFTLVHLDIQKLKGECTKAWVNYTNAAGVTRGDFVRIASLTEGQDFSRGLVRVLLPGEGRELEVALECSKGAQVQFGSLGLYDAVSWKLPQSFTN